ncbi:MAG: HPr family phosphocarrier protein [Phycisphaerae bacterium]|nr:HPr family phosphocarrier protein [Phycisphaerae bacterium]
MRPAMQFVDCASDFDADISVTMDSQTADAKSIMQLTMLAAGKGTKLTITAVGAGSQKAVEALAAIVENENASEPV